MIFRFSIFIALLILSIEAKKYSQFSPEEQWQEFEEFLKWKKAREVYENGPREIKYEERYHKDHDMYKSFKKDQKVSVDNPQPIDTNPVATVARYIVNHADWVSVATISTRKDIESFPTVTLVSYVDGHLGNGSGIPYLYLTPLDFTAQDLAEDNRATLMVTEAQGEHCKAEKWDPMDPRCARVFLTGKIKPLKTEGNEYEVAKKAFFDRHPGLVNMPADHHFYFAKLKIISIVVLDTFGGPKYIPVKDYLNSTNVTEEFNRLFPLDTYASKSQKKYNSISNMINPVVRMV